MSSSSSSSNKSKKDGSLTVRLPSDLRAEAEAAARRVHGNLSDVVMVALRAFIEHVAREDRGLIGERVIFLDEKGLRGGVKVLPTPMEYDRATVTYGSTADEAGLRVASVRELVASETEFEEVGK